VNYRISCECGEALSVQEGMAGVEVTCICQRIVKVPSLRELRSGRFPADPESTEASGTVRQRVIAISILGVIGVVVAAPVFFWLGTLTGIGLLLVIGGRVWMLAVGFWANPDLGCSLLLFPEIMMFMFAAKNPKLALPPLLCVIAGIMLFFIGLGVQM
jgi:hypothetical protein